MNYGNDASAAYKLLKEEFEKRNYSSKELIENEKLFIQLTSPKGVVWKFRAAPIRYPFTSADTIELSSRKELTYDFAQKHDMSVPFTYFLANDQEITEDQRNDLIARFAPLVVKPSNAASSKGLTLDIRTSEQLKSAIEYARSFRLNTVIQQQVQGEEVRFIVLEGKVEAALLRQNAQVVGDGRLTLAELIKLENKEREKLIFPHISYPQLTVSMIDEAYFTDSRIPEAGEIVKLNKSTMIKEGCSVYNVLEQIHPSYIQKVESLISSLEAGFLAIDIFIEDYTQPLSSNNYACIEFNTFPSLKFCYGCRDGKMFDIVPLLVDVIDRHLHGA